MGKFRAPKNTNKFASTAAIITAVISSLFASSLDVSAKSSPNLIGETKTLKKFNGYVQLADALGNAYMAGHKSSRYQRTYSKKSKYKKVPYHLGGKLPKNNRIKSYNQ